MIALDDSSNGRDVFLHVGQALKVTLSENASTGFHWMLQVKPDVLRESEEESVEAPKGPPGKGGVRHFYFEAASQGSGELLLEYRRNWEHGTKPARTFRLKVRIHE